MGEKSLRRGTDNQNGLHLLMKKDDANENDFVTKNQDFWSIGDNRGDSRRQGQRDFGEGHTAHDGNDDDDNGDFLRPHKDYNVLSDQRMGV